MFRKSEILYGLDHARQGDRAGRLGDRGRGLHRRDHAAPGRDRERAVASMGTALTERPGDASCGGCARPSSSPSTPTRPARTASLRGMELARAKGLTVRVVRLPGGRDPADVAAADRGRLRRRALTAQPYLTYRTGLALDFDGQPRRPLRARARAAFARAAVGRAGRAGAHRRRPAGAVGRPHRPAHRRPIGGWPAAPRQAAAGAAVGRASATNSCSWGSVWRSRSRALTCFDSLDVAHFADPARWEAATVVRRRLAGELAPEEEHAWAP